MHLSYVCLLSLYRKAICYMTVTTSCKTLGLYLVLLNGTIIQRVWAFSWKVNRKIPCNSLPWLQMQNGMCQIYTAVLHGRYQICITVVPSIVGGKFTLHCPQQDDHYLICIGPWGIFLHEIPEMWRYLLVCVCVYVSEQKVCCELLKLFDQTLWVGSRPCKLVYMCKWWCHRLKVK